MVCSVANARLPVNARRYWVSTFIGDATIRGFDLGNFSTSVSLPKFSREVQTTWEFVKEIYSANINFYFIKKPVNVHTLYDRIRHQDEKFY